METLLPNLYNVEKGPCTPFNLLKGFLQYFFFVLRPFQLRKGSMWDFILFSVALRLLKGVRVGFYFVLRCPLIAERGPCGILFCSPSPFYCRKGSMQEFLFSTPSIAKEVCSGIYFVLHRP